MFSCLLITFSTLYSLYLEFHHSMADSYISGSVIHYEEERFMLNGSGFPFAVQAPLITTTFNINRRIITNNLQILLFPRSCNHLFLSTCNHDQRSILIGGSFISTINWQTLPFPRSWIRDGRSKEESKLSDPQFWRKRFYFCGLHSTHATAPLGNH